MDKQAKPDDIAGSEHLQDFLYHLEQIFDIQNTLAGLLVELKGCVDEGGDKEREVLAYLFTVGGGFAVSAL